MPRCANLAGVWVLGAVLLLAPAGVRGDTGDSPATTVYATATVSERPLDSATAAVTVIDRATIESLGAATVADVLRFVPGVQVVGAGTRGSLSVAQIRGGDPNFTLVLVDGVPVNDGTYQVGGVFDFEGLPASAVERIEVVRGPFSSFYGSTGLAGVIQIFTRRGGAAGGEAAVTAGDAHHRGGEVTLSGGGRGEYFLGLAYQEEAERVGEERFEQLHATGTGAWSLGRLAGGDAHLRLAGRAARWDADDYPEASGGPLLGSGELRSSHHEEASLGAELQAGTASNRHQVVAAVYRHQLERESPAIGFLVPPSTEDTRFTRLRLGWTWTRSWSPELELSLGADAQREQGRNDSLLLLPPFLGGAVAGDYDLQRTTPGVSGQLLATAGRWTLELGSRLDWVPATVPATAPGAGGRRPAGPSSCPASSPWPAPRPSAATPSSGRR